MGDEAISLPNEESASTDLLCMRTASLRSERRCRHFMLRQDFTSTRSLGSPLKWLKCDCPAILPFQNQNVCANIEPRFFQALPLKPLE